MTRTILLADDSVTIQKVVELTFMDEDYEVVSVSNGGDAIARLKDGSPDLVIADVHMPGADGYEVCKLAKQLRADLPVLLLVGTFEPFKEEDVRSSGANGYLKKPFDSQELLRRVEDLLKGAPRSSVPAQGAVDEVAAAMVGQALPDVIDAEPVESDSEGSPLHDQSPDYVVEAIETSEEEAGSRPTSFDNETESDVEEGQEAAPPEPSSTERRSDAAMGSLPEVGPSVPSDPGPARAPGQRIDSPSGSGGESPLSDPPRVAPPLERETVNEGTPTNQGGSLSDTDIDRIARRVVELLGDRVVRDVAWEVIPDLAEIVIKDRLRELESQVEEP